MTDGESYTSERTIGHHIKAEREFPSYPEWYMRLCETRDMEPKDLTDYIRITEGDVGWSTTREVRISVDELREMALHHTDLEP